MPDDEAVPPPLEIHNCVLLVRTDFRSEDGWASLRATVARPTPEGLR